MLGLCSLRMGRVHPALLESGWPSEYEVSIPWHGEPGTPGAARGVCIDGREGVRRASGALRAVGTAG